MSNAPVQSSDIVIRQRRAGDFVLATPDNPAQLAFRTFEEALASAGHFANAHSVHLWYVDDQASAIRIERTLLVRIWAEYCELPGLGLTAAQAQRLWGVDADTCGTLLDVLVRAKLLMRGGDGRYRRVAVEAGGSGARMAKAAPKPAPENRHAYEEHAAR